MHLAAVSPYLKGFARDCVIGNSFVCYDIIHHLYQGFTVKLQFRKLLDLALLCIAV